MQYPLYELYKQSSLNLYEVREHFLKNFYYQDHSRKDAENILRSIVSSSKIGNLLKESNSKHIAPNCEDFLTTICSMLKFMFKSNDTQILATIDAALRWDVEVNAILHLETPEELKQDIIKAFCKYQVYKEMSDKDFLSLSTPMTVDAEPVEEKQPALLESKADASSWSLTSFSKMFDEMQVGEFVNKETGETFKSCVFTKGKAKTFVAFSSKLGELAPEEIEEMKGDLLVVKSKTGKYCLVKAKKSTWKKVNI